MDSARTRIVESCRLLAARRGLPDPAARLDQRNAGWPLEALAIMAESVVALTDESIARDTRRPTSKRSRVA